MTRIRPESPGDEASIGKVLELAFPSVAEARLVEALRAAGDLSISLVAEEAAGPIVGHVAFSPVTIAAPSEGVIGLGLAPVAVVPAEQRKGLGEKLIREGLRLGAARGARFVVVLGSPRFYARFGFEPARGWGIQNEYDAGDEFMALELTPPGIPRDAGLARYADAFSIVA
ncbi:MAG: N-acetyltransferase [Polyangiaceae bacterium]